MDKMINVALMGLVVMSVMSINQMMIDLSHLIK